jgi:hypothetical protein
MPVLGYAIVFNEWLIEHSNLIVGEMDTKLYFLYYGFCSLALASILFNIVCPQVLRDHGQVKEYVAAESLITNESRIRNLLVEMYELSCETKFSFGRKYGVIIDNLFNKDLPQRLQDLDGDIQIAISLLEVAKEERYYSEYLVANFDLQDVSKPIWRGTVFFFLFGGLILVAIPTIQTFIDISIKLLSQS